MRIALALALLALGLALQAQDAVPGDLVRITAPALGRHKHLFTLVAATSESVTVASHDAKPDTSTIALAAITSLEYNHAGAKHGHAGTGFVIGGLTGALFGITAVSTENTLDCAVGSLGGSGTCSNRSVAGGAVVGFAAGGTIGALIGLAIRSRTWTKAEPGGLGPPPKVAVLPTWQPAQRRFGVAAQLRF